MNPDLIKVLLVLVGVIVMLALNRPRMDVVALLALAALPLVGVVTPAEALAGFADTNVILIALLFVVGEGLVRTGVTHRLGDWLMARAGTSETRLICLLMVVVAGVGSVMSSTGVVAIFIPVVLRIADRLRAAPGRLLMPLSVAALLSGMMTLVATPPNLVVQRELVDEGHRGFGFFSFTPLGLPLLGLAIAWMLVARRWLGRPAGSGTTAPAPRPQMAEWIDEYDLAARKHRLRVSHDSPLVGRTLRELDLRSNAGINLLVIERTQPELIVPSAQTRIAAHDILFADAFAEDFDLAAVTRRLGLEPLSLPHGIFARMSRELGMAEVVIPARSPLAGQTIAAARFRSVHDLAVIGLKQGMEPAPHPLRDQPLRAGNTLLLVGPWRAIRRLQSNQGELVLLNLPAEYDATPPAANRAPLALAALGLMIVLMVTGAVPNVQAALLTCLLLGACGCVDLASAYRSIQWPTLILIVGMIPFAVALQRTGGVALAAHGLIEVAGASHPRFALAAVFVLTAVLGMFISNTATAILMAPVALTIAAQLKLDPHPFAMTVALAASAAFMTPVSSPVNTLVVGPGSYRFLDFVRVGVPLTLLTLVVSVVVVPWLLPF